MRDNRQTLAREHRYANAKRTERRTRPIQLGGNRQSGGEHPHAMRGNTKKKGKDTCILCKATTKNRAALVEPMPAFNAGAMDGERGWTTLAADATSTGRRMRKGTRRWKRRAQDTIARRKSAEYKTAIGSGGSGSRCSDSIRTQTTKERWRWHHRESGQCECSCLHQMQAD